MLPAATIDTNTRLLYLYDKYSPFLYAVLLKLTNTRANAESILVELFEKIYQGNVQCSGTSLLKFAVMLAYERAPGKEDFLERFNALPVMYRLMVGNMFPGIPSNNVATDYRKISEMIVCELKLFTQQREVRSMPAHQ